jgi:hypothetical protein
MIDLPGPLAVVCHDAGAANLILAWLAADPRPDVRPVMHGPAVSLWQERFDDATLRELEAAMDGAAAVLSGTGWQSDREHLARLHARQRGIRSVAVLDHWTDYAARFVRDGQTVLPDEFWVVDEAARALAFEAFPEAVIRLKPNNYLHEQVARIGPCPAGDRLLYVLEPARSNWGREDPGEFQALDFLIGNFDKVGVPPSVPIRLRPHPSDPTRKYQRWIEAQRGFDIALDESRSLAEAISCASIVAGAQTFAMVIALAAGRKVFCTLPPWAPRCALPHSGIIHLSSLTDPAGLRAQADPSEGL